MRHKVIFVGDAGVGKTCLITAFHSDKTFEESTHSTVAPSAEDFSVVLETGETVNLAVWDTAGQEKFQSITRSYYHGSELAIICTDAEQIDTIEKWSKQVSDTVQNCKIVVVLTKIDLLEASDIPMQLQQEASRLNLGEVVCTSAKTRQNVDLLMKKVAQMVKDVKNVNNVDIHIRTGDKDGEGCKC